MPGFSWSAACCCLAALALTSLPRSMSVALILCHTPQKSWQSCKFLLSGKLVLQVFVAVSVLLLQKERLEPIETTFVGYHNNTWEAWRRVQGICKLQSSSVSVSVSVIVNPSLSPFLSWAFLLSLRTQSHAMNLDCSQVLTDSKESIFRKDLHVY